MREQVYKAGLELAGGLRSKHFCEHSLRISLFKEIVTIATNRRAAQKQLSKSERSLTRNSL